MTPLELVPSYEACMELTKRGIIILDCVFCWVRDNDDQQVKFIEQSRMEDVNDLKGEVTFLSHAPTAGELEEWLMTKWPLSKRLSSIVVEWVLLHAKDKEATYRVTGTGIGGMRIIVGKASIVSALAALVLEVAG